MPEYFLGIDGGGTSCRAAVSDRSGTILGRALAGSANISTDLDGALQTILAVSREALEQAGLDPDLVLYPAYLGLAGSMTGQAGERLKQHLPFSGCEVRSDGLIALEGALGPKDGMIAILGTGSLFMARQDSEVRALGGRGFLLGDHGGGARLGRALLEECLLACDGLRSFTPLLERTMAGFEGDVSSVIAFAKSSAPSAFAAYAADVFKAAGQGDEAALQILGEAARLINLSLDKIRFEGCEALCLLGGLSKSYKLWIAAHHRELLREPEGDGLTGAISLAIRTFG
ncbi:BadF/BadG/BcrA/BcrD ATPase family protein [Roseibium litorale]|uniref:N-acetylglucosamine kinase n=1 Tax=Roseibium litorale TaxID=2803841 RepID=A0ABR9CIX6_9HYPH|nr:BadF/BadG/BcrA/BcrD ATPase family protein [Roseibium litorale]MBD8890774.1 N-acetylglucosamine kinase [Roseibium litorale]